MVNVVPPIAANAGRPKRMRREARIAAILAAAREVFEEAGYEGAKVADIAERLGISEGNIYAFFGSKRELMAQVIAQWYRTSIAPLQDGLRHIVGTREKLRFLIAENLRFMVDNAELCAVVLKESRVLGDPEPDRLLEELRREHTEPLMRLLAEGIERGEFKPDVSLTLVRSMIYGALEHVLWDVLVSGRSVDVERTAEELTRTALNGLVDDQAVSAASHARFSALLDRMELALAPDQ